MSETNEKQTTASDAEPLAPAFLHTPDGAKNSGGSDDELLRASRRTNIRGDFHGLSDVSCMTFGAAHASASKLHSLICGVAPNSKALVAGRAVAGLGSAGLSVGGTSIIAFTASLAKRPLIIGLIGTTHAVSAVLGPIIGVSIGGVAALAVFFFFTLPAATSSHQVPWKEKLLHIDLGGVALAMEAIISFILAPQHAGSTCPWNSGHMIGLCRYTLHIYNLLKMVDLNAVESL